MNRSRTMYRQVIITILYCFMISGSSASRSLYSKTDLHTNPGEVNSIEQTFSVSRCPYITNDPHARFVEILNDLIKPLTKCLLDDYVSYTQVLYSCTQKYFTRLKSELFEMQKWDVIKGPITGVSTLITHKVIHTSITTNDSFLSVNANDSNPRILCQLDRGSLSRIPSIFTCGMKPNSSSGVILQQHEGVAACDVHMTTGRPNRHSCNQRFVSKTLVYVKVAWVFAKFNYGLIIPTILCTLIQQCKRKSQCVHLFGVVSVLWMIWRLQETLHWDTKWQYQVPYICVATNSVRYLVEGVALFLFACTSVERYQSIAGSSIKTPTRKNKKQAAVAISIGTITGMICSILNIIALSIMTSPPALVLKTCSISDNLANNLTPLIIAKVLSLVVMYLVPCITMVIANFAMSRHIRKKAKQNLGRCYSKKQKGSRRKTSIISSFLVFSSVFMMCCVSKPIFEVYVVIKIHIDGLDINESNPVGMLLDAITWNLTTIAYTINTVLGLRYTK